MDKFPVIDLLVLFISPKKFQGYIENEFSDFPILHFCAFEHIIGLSKRAVLKEG